MTRVERCLESLCFMCGLGWGRPAGTREQFKDAGPEYSGKMREDLEDDFSEKRDSQVGEILF